MDLTAQRSVFFYDDFYNTGMDIPNIERCIRFLDEHIVLRIHTAATKTLFVAVCKLIFFSHKHAPFCFEIPPGHGTNPAGRGPAGLSRLSAITVLGDNHSGKRTGMPWRAERDSNPRPDACAKHCTSSVRSAHRCAPPHYETEGRY